MKKLKGANMDIDLASGSTIDWKQDDCPWNKKEMTKEHKCAVKNISICKHFRGIEYPDTILCSFDETDKT